MSGLFDDPEPLRPTDRLFFAVFPDAGTAARIAVLADGLRGQLNLRGRPLAPERFHITISHLGDYVGVPESVVEPATTAAASLTAAPFEVTFDRAASFHGRSGNRPFVLRGGEGLAGVIAFQQQLGAAMVRSGLRPDRNFTPHVTLLYDDALVPETPVAPISWTAAELVLVHSLLGRTQHIALRRWPLAA
ncbi:2'-5' RNA ligase [Caulobacter ginsengisoli]|uniref:2'-5' RNA ligase n=1 Tax=Caulobacter ginsengisoli TaxID=400775 RepID=A0ABU0IMT8_9CAUL|nr:2'-5' RNA ligase family protein [Caulobacter ginsengisoli]MDQ0463312.1 2'-5' RNA ligase [Caulobacter ginsengisoli]